jgi:beta-lactam-binding protein with PASTA domain
VKLIKYLFFALVLVTVALVSALTAMRLAIHGREVRVPNLVGMAPAEAERACANTGMSMAVEGRFYSPQVPEGKIVSQTPPAGSMVRRGWRMGVAISLGPQRVSIPDVVGNSERAAEMNIRRRGLELGTVAAASIPDQAANVVVAQDPPGNAAGVSSPRVNLLVNAPTMPEALLMPDFVGKHSDEAIHAVRDAGLRLVGLNRMTQPGVVPDIIVRQSPAPGQKVAAGMGVVFDVAE